MWLLTRQTPHAPILERHPISSGKAPARLATVSLADLGRRGRGIVGIVALCNLWVVLSTHNLIVTDVHSASVHEVALVLGTSKNVAPGRANRHFANRVRRAAALYKAGRVKHLLVSGDNSSRYYNEPNDMLEALKEDGIPAEVITRDFAGFRAPGLHYPRS